VKWCSRSVPATLVELGSGVGGKVRVPPRRDGGGGDASRAAPPRHQRERDSRSSLAPAPGGAYEGLRDGRESSGTSSPTSAPVGPGRVPADRGFPGPAPIRQHSKPHEVPGFFFRSRRPPSLSPGDAVLVGLDPSSRTAPRAWEAAYNEHARAWTAEFQPQPFLRVMNARPRRPTSTPTSFRATSRSTDGPETGAWIEMPAGCGRCTATPVPRPRPRGRRETVADPPPQAARIRHGESAANVQYTTVSPWKTAPWVGRV